MGTRATTFGATDADRPVGGGSDVPFRAAGIRWRTGRPPSSWWAKALHDVEVPVRPSAHHDVETPVRNVAPLNIPAKLESRP